MKPTWLVLVLLLGGGALAQSSTQRGLDGVGARMKAAVDDGRTPSLVAAVGREGRILWSAAFGMADKARAIPASTAIPYSLASAPSRSPRPR